MKNRHTDRQRQTETEKHVGGEETTDRETKKERQTHD